MKKAIKVIANNKRIVNYTRGFKVLINLKEFDINTMYIDTKTNCLVILPCKKK